MSVCPPDYSKHPLMEEVERQRRIVDTQQAIAASLSERLWDRTHELALALDALRDIRARHAQAIAGFSSTGGVNVPTNYCTCGRPLPCPDMEAAWRHTT